MSIGLLPETFDIKILSLVGIVISLCFWYLDGFFLKTEKLYRWKYEWVIANRESCSDFKYDLNPDNSEMWLPDSEGNAKKAPYVIRVMFTKTVTPIYLPIIALLLYLFFSN